MLKLVNLLCFLVGICVICGFFGTRAEIANETVATPLSVNITEDEQGALANAKELCLSMMDNDTYPRDEGPFCNRTWDGTTCWPTIPAGLDYFQECPDFIKGFVRGRFAYRICGPDGIWNSSDYSECYLSDSKIRMKKLCSRERPLDPRWRVSVYSYNVTNQTCEDAISEESKGICYNYDQSGCCRHCFQFRNDSNPGCEYGDQYPSRCQGDDMSNTCYWKERRTCCQTCKLYIREELDHDCRYGDHSTNCDSLHPFDCNSQSGSCCETCKKYRTGIHGCEYGDQPMTFVLKGKVYPNCAAMRRSPLGPLMCKVKSIARKCCESCGSTERRIR